MNLVQTIYKLNINLLDYRSTPPWWREAGESGTKQLYQPKPRPVTYIVPINRILGRLSLSPVGVHGKIPVEMQLCLHLCPDAAIYLLTATSNEA